MQKNLKGQGPEVGGLKPEIQWENGFLRAERVVDTQVQMEEHESFVALVLPVC